MNKPTSAKPSTSDQTQSNSVKHEERTWKGSGFLLLKPKTQSHKVKALSAFKLILQFSFINASQAKPLSYTRDRNFNFVNEEIVFMAVSTDHQLLTMKVNLTQLEEWIVSFIQVIETQRKAVRKYQSRNTSRRASHLLVPSKQRLEESMVD